MMAHRLRSFDVTMLVISLVIGIGIFRTPQLVAAQAGTVPLFALAWVLGAVFSMCGALTFARIGTLHPVTGGFYSIFSACYHPGFAFAMNWSLVVTNAASMAGVALIGAEYLAPVIIHGTVEKWHLDAIVVTTVLVLYLVNVGGLRMGARAQNLLSLLKVILILGLCAVVIVAPGNPQPALVSS
ncbi:MAG: APC family permease, partial [Candidatus Kapaibacterium sp.]